MNDENRDQGLKCLGLDLGQTFSDLIHIWRRHVLILFLGNKIRVSIKATSLLLVQQLPGCRWVPRLRTFDCSQQFEEDDQRNNPSLQLNN